MNAEQLAAGVAGDDLFAQQVSSADLLVLNQLDRVDASEIPRLEARLRELEPEAPILRAVHARVDPDLLFPPDPSGLRAARRTRAAAPPPHTHEEFHAEEIALEPGLSSAALLREAARARRPAHQGLRRDATKACAWCRASARASSWCPPTVRRRASS